VARIASLTRGAFLEGGSHRPGAIAPFRRCRVRWLRFAAGWSAL